MKRGGRKNLLPNLDESYQFVQGVNSPIGTELESKRMKMPKPIIVRKMNHVSTNYCTNSTTPKSGLKGVNKFA